MRLYNEIFQIGARAYNAQTRRPVSWHPGPVKDAESFCRRYLDEAFDGWGMFLRPDTYADSLQELIIILQRLERRYDPERMETFEQFARWVIPQRAVDVGPRRVLGRNGSRIHDYVFDELDESIKGSEFGGVVPEIEGGAPADWGRDARWLQPDHARERARANVILGLRPAKRAA